MTETTQLQPTPQTIAPSVWTRLDGMPDIEIYHAEPAAIQIAARRTAGVAVMNSGGALPQDAPAIEIPWSHP
jgi:hypothetical protein